MLKTDKSLQTIPKIQIQNCTDIPTTVQMCVTFQRLVRQKKCSLRYGRLQLLLFRWTIEEESDRANSIFGTVSTREERVATLNCYVLECGHNSLQDMKHIENKELAIFANFKFRIAFQSNESPCIGARQWSIFLRAFKIDHCLAPMHCNYCNFNNSVLAVYTGDCDTQKRVMHAQAGP